MMEETDGRVANACSVLLRLSRHYQANALLLSIRLALIGSKTRLNDRIEFIANVHTFLEHLGNTAATRMTSARLVIATLLLVLAPARPYVISKTTRYN